MGRTAAIFDLDRTLLRGASGPLINEALTELGLRSTKVPGEGLLYKSYELFGENPLGMAFVRAAALAVRGWPVDRLRAAGRKAAELLINDLAAYVPGLLEEHRRAGHVLVLATTTPEDLVRPLAEQLGMDDVVATRYAWTDGVYTGRLDGGFVWGFGKLTALRKWAERNDVDLSESFAYSDSINDLPMLSAVGHPSAVNPDLALHALATLRRWPVLHLDVPPGVATLAGMEAFDAAKVVVRPELFPYARFDIDGVENIPDTGGFILVANHRSYFDVAAVALVVQKKGRPTRFLGKKEVFDAPIVGQIARALGGISVERAGDPASSLGPAERVLRAGEGIVVLPQGTIPRGKAFFEPELKGKTGAARLAASTGAAVIPVGLWNTEAVWPRSSTLPRLTNVLSPPTVRIRVGPAVAGLGLGPSDAVADTEKIMAAIAALLPDEARELHEPTEDELARTYPKGKVGEERAVGLAPAASPRHTAPAAKRPAAKRPAAKKAGAVSRTDAAATVPAEAPRPPKQAPAKTTPAKKTSGRTQPAKTAPAKKTSGKTQPAKKASAKTEAAGRATTARAATLGPAARKQQPARVPAARRPR
ncbi:MAG: HAD-IB family hydrolase [Acidimicrobiales bacterium]|jgi:putative phosphoserine phosphatase / 1-acylglycerol-3-phosphate O-acyltransferase